jgi:hypothetical protein
MWQWLKLVRGASVSTSQPLEEIKTFWLMVILLLSIGGFTLGPVFEVAKLKPVFF